MINEEESKKLRIFQREKRQELQLIIQRCNEVNFNYVCVPRIRREGDLVFGTKNARKIHQLADKEVNSFMRRCLKEFFPESKLQVQPTQIDSEETEVKEIRLTFPFSSKVPRFPTDVIDSSGIYRRKKKTKEIHVENQKIYPGFGSTSARKFLITKEILKFDNPGPGVYQLEKPKKLLFDESFGGERKIRQAFEIVCSSKNIDTKCDLCEEEIQNVYWKNTKISSILCRSCYNRKCFDIQTKCRGVVDRFRKMRIMNEDYKKYRSCEFYHNHNNTTAAVRLLKPREFQRRLKDENCLNILFKY